jgi:hypothetical protein
MVKGKVLLHCGKLSRMKFSKSNYLQKQEWHLNPIIKIHDHFVILFSSTILREHQCPLRHSHDLCHLLFHNSQVS